MSMTRGTAPVEVRGTGAEGLVDEKSAAAHTVPAMEFREKEWPTDRPRLITKHQRSVNDTIC